MATPNQLAAASVAFLGVEPVIEDGCEIYLLDLIRMDRGGAAMTVAQLAAAAVNFMAMDEWQSSTGELYLLDQA